MCVEVVCMHACVWGREQEYPIYGELASFFFVHTFSSSPSSSSSSFSPDDDDDDDNDYPFSFPLLYQSLFLNESCKP